MTIKDYDYIYLHGFASSPQSSKAQFYKNKFEEFGVKINIPDLNGEDFPHLTLSRQLKQVQQIINSCNKPILLIGSSMGGITSYILAENNPNIKKIISLAPAFQMSELWADGISDDDLQIWQNNGYHSIFHYGYGKQTQLHYEFYTDLFNHNDHSFKRHIDSLIFHGKKDDVVPIKLSEAYVQTNPNATLITLDDNHSINKYLDYMWEMSIDFICK
ncbi:MAG: YqiA/YcfP family alpha/beta fold hydrolase [Neisseriaceae bacterium]|jgi:predicted esterase YcpF (UPF0227 family)